ncbi:PAS domain S-box protein [soil metagenome]
MNNSDFTFQLIVESIPTAIVLVNNEGKIAYVNSQTEKLYGYTRIELIGQLVVQLIPLRYRDGDDRFWELFFSNPHVKEMGGGQEFSALRKDGSEFLIDIGLNPLVTAGGTLVLISIVDITERKKAEERFRQVVEAAPNAQVLVNSAGKITLVNSQMEKMFGYKRSELISQNMEILVPASYTAEHPNTRGSFFESPPTRAMGGGRDLFVVRKDGSELQVEISVNAIETPEGPLELITIIDVTEQKVQEAIINKQMVLLELKNKEMEQFAYIASHDLQEPLRTMSNFISIIQKDYKDQLEGTGMYYLQTIDEAIDRLRLLVRALLDFSRIGKDRLLVRTDINNITRDTLANLRNLIETSGAVVEVGPMPQLNVYEVELGQLFQNLLTNAIKFSEPGVLPRVNVTSEKIATGWQFAIADNGIGIEPKYFERIFDIFQRLHSESEYKGSGIGLANCKKIVDMHEGKIWIESTVGKGSTFYFTIPNLQK